MRIEETGKLIYRSTTNSCWQLKKESSVEPAFAKELSSYVVRQRDFLEDQEETITMLSWACTTTVESLYWEGILKAPTIKPFLKKLARLQQLCISYNCLFVLTSLGSLALRSTLALVGYAAYYLPDQGYLLLQEAQYQALLYVESHQVVPWAVEKAAQFKYIVHAPTVSYKEGVPHITFFHKWPTYTGTPAKRRIVRPGRYLATYANDPITIFSAPRIEQLVCEIEGPETLHFASSADDIEEVYLTGPNSCMSRKLDSFSVDIHPVRVYAAGDLAIAYLMNTDEEIVARCVCWPTKKQYSDYMYGDHQRLKQRLIQLGWIVSDNFYGARLLRIQHDATAFVMPYLDGNPGVRKSKNLNFLEIFDNSISPATILCDSTSGMGLSLCRHCHEYIDAGRTSASCYNCGLKL